MRDAVEVLAPYSHLLPRPVDAVADDLEFYARLLEKWQRVQNLVSRETLKDLWTRHVADSLQLLNLFGSETTAVMDFGSGGGFPATPLAIALKQAPVSFTLVESNARKVSFLRTVARELELAVTVEGRRSSEIDPRETSAPDVITARALASLDQLCGMMAPFFGPNTKAVLHKGREHVEELRESDAHWQFDVVIHKSATDPDGVLLEMRNLRAKSIR